MINTQSSRTISIDSIIITDRTRKELGEINSLAESIALFGLLQPIVINENNKLIDGQRRIMAYKLLGKTEIPCYIVSLEQIIIGEFHANSNRKEFTSSERVAISIAVEDYVREHSGGVGRPRDNQKVNEIVTKYSSDRSTNNVVKLTTFPGRVKDNVSRYFGISQQSN